MAFKNFYKQMKAPYAVYADFECVLKKIATCEQNNKKSFTIKTEKHEPCGLIVRSVMDRLLVHTLIEVKTLYLNFSDLSWSMKLKCAKTWQTKGRWS